MNCSLRLLQCLESFRLSEKPVLKADILRYSLLLRGGGIYTDMDTTSVRPFKEWGTTGVRDLVSNGSLVYLSEPLTSTYLSLLQLSNSSSRPTPRSKPSLSILAIPSLLRICLLVSSSPSKFRPIRPIGKALVTSAVSRLFNGPWLQSPVIPSSSTS